MNEIALKGTIIGFEEYQDYVLRDTFGANSAFRVLVCATTPLAFVLVNPFSVTDNYSIEIGNSVLRTLQLRSDAAEHIAVMCIARHMKPNWLANLRSPLIINTAENRFQQIILQDENYAVSMPITVVPEGR